VHEPATERARSGHRVKENLEFTVDGKKEDDGEAIRGKRGNAGGKAKGGQLLVRVSKTTGRK